MANILKYFYPKNRFLNVANNLAAELNDGKAYLKTEEFPKEYESHYQFGWGRIIGAKAITVFMVLFGLQILVILLFTADLFITKSLFGNELRASLYVFHILAVELALFGLASSGLYHGGVKRITRRSS